MATFELTGPDGGTYHVDAPDEQAALSAFSAFHTGKVAAPDKYQQAASKDIAAVKAAGGDEGAGYTRRLVHGATLGADSTILAGLETPLEMIRHRTFDPREGYNYAKAREDQIMNDARKNTGLLGDAAEVLGGGVTGGGLTNAGVTASRFLAPEAGVLARSGAMGADSAALGGVAGFNEGNSLEDRAKNAVKGGATGFLFGAGTPIAGAVAHGVTAPIFANVRARINPEGYAQSQVARAVHESGMSPNQIEQRVQQAATEGQPEFTIADALGNPGQRMLSAVARGPGEGRTAVVNALERRQAGQGERLSDAIDTALGTGATARQTTKALTDQARETSNPLYAQALENPAWSERLQQFWDDPIMKRGLREGAAIQRLESLAAEEKFNPHDAAITGFNEAGDPILEGVPNMRTINIAKKGIDNILEGYRDPITGKLNLDEHGRAIEGVRKAFLNEVDKLNPDYAAARAAYAGPAQVREAVGTGQRMASRGRAADNIGQFNALSEPAKQGARIGYADNLLGKIENAAPGIDKSRALTTPKRQQELDALSLHNGPYRPGEANPLDRFVQRERTMVETRNQALGGSRTADNLADAEAMGVNPHLIGQILTGNWHGAVRSVLAAGHNAVTGNTPAVRKAVADILLRNGVNGTPAQLARMVDGTIARLRFVQNLARAGNTARLGAAVATGEQLGVN